MNDLDREYTRTHPWINFSLDLQRAPHALWLLLGEARSKCERLGCIPLPPRMARGLLQVALVKGLRGTTAIEGNTLTEEQVEKIVTKKPDVPPSQDYLKKEVENVLTALNGVTEELKESESNPRLTTGVIQGFNRDVLRDLELEEGVIPGAIRTYPVGVPPNYRGAPYQDCEYLVDRLCEWLEDSTNESLGLAMEIIKAIVAHLYMAWIHPFGDGNGRTARLVEFHVLVTAGVPVVAAHLLSNHYNLTRDRYRRELSRASESGGDVIPFIMYALEGFVEQLSDQLETIQQHELGLSWRDFVNEYFELRTSPAEYRRKDLLMALSSCAEPVKRRDIRTIHPRIEEAYRGKTRKTITRDLNWLKKHCLVLENDKGYSARVDIILGFLPFRRNIKSSSSIAPQQL